MKVYSDQYYYVYIIFESNRNYILIKVISNSLIQNKTSWHVCVVSTNQGCRFSLNITRDTTWMDVDVSNIKFAHDASFQPPSLSVNQILTYHA